MSKQLLTLYSSDFYITIFSNIRYILIALGDHVLSGVNTNWPLPSYRSPPVCNYKNVQKAIKHYEFRAYFLSLARSKLRLCSANHRTGYFSNLSCDWLSIVWPYSETENGPRCQRICIERYGTVLWINLIQWNFTYIEFITSFCIKLPTLSATLLVVNSMKHWLGSGQFLSAELFCVVLSNIISPHWNCAGSWNPHHNDVTWAWPRDM